MAQPEVVLLARPVGLDLRILLHVLDAGSPGLSIEQAVRETEDGPPHIGHHFSFQLGRKETSGSSRRARGRTSSAYKAGGVLFVAPSTTLTPQCYTSALCVTF